MPTPQPVPGLDASRDPPADQLGRILNRAAALYRKPESQGHAAALARLVARATLNPPLPDANLRTIAVLGPTQVGKSTVVNLLLGADLAGVSPLAGFTTCPEGFLIDADPRTLQSLCDPPCPLRAASRPPGWPADGGWLIWDTPDFDTLAAGAYRERLLSVVAASGTIVVVLSAEKYADLSVWQMLHVLALLKRPIVFVLNKLPAADADASLAAFRAHVRQQMPELASAAERALWLPLSPAAGRATDAADPQIHPAIERLRQQLADTPILDRLRLRRAAARLIRAFWDEWTAAIRAEHAALRRFDRQIDGAAQRFVQRYREAFLDDPQRYDTLHRLTEELLTLLDVPYLAPWLGEARRLAGLPGRWMMRQLGRLWQRWAPVAHRATGSEQLVLGQLVDQTLVALTRFCLRQAERGDAAPFWQALSQRLEQREPQLRRELEAQIRRHDEAFRHEIRDEAEKLYARIRENRVLLNSLRVGRLGSDVASVLAGVVVAFTSTSTGPGGFALTPVMFSLTQSLTEGALGAYRLRIAARLKQRQLEHLRRDFVDARLRPQLAALARELEGPDVWNISEEDLAAAEAEIRRLETAL